MEVAKGSLDDYDILLNEEPQNRCQTATNDKLPELNIEENDLYISNVTDTKESEMCDMQGDDQNENVDFAEKDAYTQAINEILNEESVSENIDEMPQLESTRISLEENYVPATINENMISGNSSSDEEILQTRFSVQDNIYAGEYNNAKNSDSFVSISDKESIAQNDSDIEKTPTQVDNKEESVDNKTSDLNSEIERVEENKDQRATTDIANHLSLSTAADNSNMNTDINCLQYLITNNDENVPLNECDLLIRELMKSTTNEINFNQNIEETNDASSDFVVEDFLNGTLDVSVFKSVKKSPMINDEKIITEENRLVKNEPCPSKQEKRRGNVRKNSNYSKKRYSSLNYNNKAEHTKINKSYNNLFSSSTFNSEVPLKRKISRKQTESSKKAKITTVKNIDEVTDTTSDILNKRTFKCKSGLENRGSKANSPFNQVNNQLKYHDKSITNLKGFEMKEDISKKSRTKSNTSRTKAENKEKMFKDNSYRITPLKKSRGSRNCSLIASKKIKDIEKLENSGSYEEIYPDSERFDSKNEKFEHNYKSIFQDGKRKQKLKTEINLKYDKSRNKDTLSIASLDSFQVCTKNNRVTKSNRKRNSELEGIFGAYRMTPKRKSRDDNKVSKNNFISENNNNPYVFVEENDNMYESQYSNRKKVGSRRQSKNNEKSENTALKYRKSTNKMTPNKHDTINMNCGAVTRLKRKTWDTLQKELLGESNDAPLSNNVTKTALLMEQPVMKQNRKDEDMYSFSDKSAIQTANRSTNRNKYDGKYEMQNMEIKCLQAPTHKIQSDSNRFIEKIRSNEIVPYKKSENVVEKTIAAMEKCTAKFIAPKVNFTERTWTRSELKFDRLINEGSIDQEAEFHSNMTVMRNKNKQYFKNEIVAVLKQSNSKKNAPSVYYDEEYKYGLNDAEHLIKRSIITESYSVKNNAEENHKIETQASISTKEEKQIDPWTRLIKELNLEENKDKNNSNSGYSCRKPLMYNENVKQNVNTHPNTDVEIYKQDENEESEEVVLKQAIFEESSVLPNYITASSDLNVEDNCTNDTESKRKNNENAESSNEYTTEKTKIKNVLTKEKTPFQMKKVRKSPKFKLQVKEDGGVKFKKCTRSLSSSSEESGNQKQRSKIHDDKKYTKDKNKSERQDYKKYLNNLFKKEDSLSQEKFKRDNREKGLFKEQRKMDNILIAKDDNDIFSVSSSDSETVDKKRTGSGLLYDVLDD